MFDFSPHYVMARNRVKLSGATVSLTYLDLFGSIGSLNLSDLHGERKENVAEIRETGD